MSKFKVGIVVGSNRRESINRRLAQAIAKLADGRVLARFVQIDDLPMYNQDAESPLPAGVARFKSEIEQADALSRHRSSMQRARPIAPTTTGFAVKSP